MLTGTLAKVEEDLNATKRELGIKENEVTLIDEKARREAHEKASVVIKELKTEVAKLNDELHKATEEMER